MSAAGPLARVEAALAHPALSAVRGAATVLLQAVPPTVVGVRELDGALSARAGVRFVVQAPRARRRRVRPPPEEGYDGQITLRGEVPTREDSVHDLLNALVWASFPQSKRALHARQLRAQQRRAAENLSAQVRSREQDVLTMLDEGGVLWVTSRVAAAQEALVHADHAALATMRAEGRAEALVFGHALAEHVVLGRAGVPRATVVVLGAGSQGGVDAALRAQIEDGGCFQAPDPWPAVSLSLLLGEA